MLQVRTIFIPIFIDNIFYIVSFKYIYVDI